MNDQKDSPVSFVLIKKNNVLSDGEIINKENKLGLSNNNGRKILAADIREDFGEELIDNPIWRVPKILTTGNGGIEISTFTEYSNQDRHKHLKGTEIYTILKGKLEIFVNDEGPFTLNEMDEIVILPGTVHEIVQGKFIERKNLEEDFDLVVRVHSVNCFGSGDKYVQLEPDGEWKLWEDLSNDERKRAFKKSNFLEIK